MLLRLVMKRKQRELGLLEQATKRPEFSSVLQQLFSEFRAFRVGPNDLERGAQSVKNKVLQKKLRELAICMAAYEEEINRHGERDIDPIMEIVGFASISTDGKQPRFYRWLSLVYTYTLRVDLHLV